MSPKLTKAEQKEQRLAEEAKQLATYMPRLIKTLEAATEYGWPIHFSGGVVKVEILDYASGRSEEDCILPTLDYAANDLSDLENLERALGYEHERREKAAADEALRKVTLLKLSAEERRVLGV